MFLTSQACLFQMTLCDLMASKNVQMPKGKTKKDHMNGLIWCKAEDEDSLYFMNRGHFCKVCGVI